MFVGPIESYKQCYEYNNIHIDMSFEIEKGELNIKHNNKHAARQTQIDSQVEKQTYTHDADS